MDKWRCKLFREREIFEFMMCNMCYMIVDVEKIMLIRKKCFIFRFIGILYLLCFVLIIFIYLGNFFVSFVF